MFPEVLRDPILRKVQFSTVGRMDELGVYPFRLISHVTFTDNCPRS